MDNQRECAICYEKSDSLKIQCQCNLCIDCFKEYTRLQIREFWTSDGSHLFYKCPGHCGEILYFDQIVDVAISNNFDPELQWELFRKYCTKATDIIACPNNTCNFYYLQPCKWACDQICEGCNSKLEKQGKFILSQCLQNNLTKFIEFITTNQCPRCEVLITKNGGCSHMTCRFCKYEFCWDCKQNCKSHDWTICILHNLIIIFLKYIFAYQLLYQLGIHIYLLLLLEVIFQLSYCFILNNTILGLIWLLGNSIKLLNESIEPFQRRMIKHRILFSSSILIILSLIANQIVEITFLNWIWYLVKELFYSLIGIILLTIMNHFYKLLFK